jgi:hypothetical protein
VRRFSLIKVRMHHKKLADGHGGCCRCVGGLDKTATSVYAQIILLKVRELRMAIIIDSRRATFSGGGSEAWFLLSFLLAALGAGTTVYYQFVGNTVYYCLAK